MKKRLLALFVAVCACLCVLPPGMAAEAGALLVIEAPAQFPAVGEEFTVTVSLENNPGFYSVQFYLLFDNAALRCTEVVPGEKMPPLAAYNHDADGVAAVAAGSMDLLTGDGVIATLSFTVTAPTNDPQFRMEQLSLGDHLGDPMDCQYEIRRSDKQPSENVGQGPISSNPSPPAQTPPATDVSAPQKSFSDVQTHWGKEAIGRSVELGLFKGFPDGTFHPDEPVSRAQFVTVLWRSAGTPESEGPCPFTDLADQIPEFQSAVAWAYESGAVQGVSDTEFAPLRTLTRQEAMTILYRYAGAQPGMEVMFTGIYDSQFPDSGQIAPWAKAAMYWGVYRQLIQGADGGDLAPTAFASRAQIAKIMVQFQDITQKGEVER